MVAIAARSQNTRPSSRLTMQTIEIGTRTLAIRSLDWDRDRFDIEFGLRNGTTYNSFLIQGEKTALIDTTHRKFEQLYLDILTKLIDPAAIDYLIISHPEPDHSGLVKEILQLAPHVIVVGAKIAIQFLENMVHQPFKHQIVKNGDRIDLGNGHQLEFVSAPNLHWPDTIFTYDAKTQILFTCDVFGMHYCDDYTFDEEPNLIEEDFKYYYDCLMGPNARSVLSALKRIEKLEISTIATGHGPLLQHHITDWIGRYQSWSQEVAKTDTLVAIFYTEDYGWSDRVARAIESMLQVGDRFVLNVLEEGNYQALMRHLLKRLPPGGDRFAGIKTYAASNGTPILADALAYMECEVSSRMECSDHWIIYSTVKTGRVAKPDALTAVHHRKVGNHY
jgi:flavorubredoxin